MTGFNRGDKVYKLEGYPFPGIVDVVFRTQAGEDRMVVEFCDADDLPTGLLHIFNLNQFAKRGDL